MNCCMSPEMFSLGALCFRSFESQALFEIIQLGLNFVYSTTHTYTFPKDRNGLALNLYHFF